MKLPVKKNWGVLLPSVGLIWATNSFAQTSQNLPEQVMEEITVVGTHIKGAVSDGVLPVTTITKDDIATIGASSGDDILRSIPQMGEIAFNNEREVGGINDARGDVASINLRSLGTGNTLTLFNGRRLVLHPGTQSENLVPVVTVNSNTLPVKGLERVEVLRDGAAAIYGTDAVAGVINFVTRDDYEGGEVSVRYNDTESTHMDETTLTGAYGFGFNGGQSHLTFTGGYYHRDPMLASDRPYSASNDRRNYPGLPADFVGDSQLNNTLSAAPWGMFYTGTADIGSQRFRIQPDTIAGCNVPLPGGICRDNTTSTALPDEIKFDAAPYRTMTNEVDRYNMSAMLNHDISANLELYGEFLYYFADSTIDREQDSVLSTQRFTIADTAAANPFGQLITVRSYRPVDAGPRETAVEDRSVRLLGGLRGNFGGDWDWDSALLYSKATSSDVTANQVRLDKFQQAINSTSLATAYDIFNGASLTSPMTLDDTPNAASVIQSFVTSVSRKNETELTLADFKVTNNNLFSLPGGGAGLAAGMEWREETYSDDRDALLDGSTPFFDMNTGLFVADSVVLGTSATPDTEGDRRVTSLFAELALPVLSWLDFQLAARYEDYSDVGDVLKPKVAFAISPVEWLQFRGAYSEAFRAPNIAQVSDEGVVRVNSGRQDPVTGSTSVSVESHRSGSDSLEPEEDENVTLGIVLKPLAAMLVTVDWWQIEQEGVIGILGDRNQIFYDALLRFDYGTTNPNVVRGPGGDILYVNDNYMNLQPRTIKGVDIAVHYDLDTDSLGSFRFSFNGAYLSKFFQEPDNISQLLIDARAAGNPAVTQDITTVDNLIKLDGRPRWRHTAAINWQLDALTVGVSGEYISDFVDTGVDYTGANGKDVYLPIDSYKQVNIYGSYRIENSGFLGDTIISGGVRNLTDRDPPLADSAFGYFSGLHSNRGRQAYLELTQHF